MAKSSKPRPDKAPPVPNEEALQRYAVECNRQSAKVPSGAGITVRSPNLETLFLEGLAEGYSVTSSAWTIGVHRATVYKWRDDTVARRAKDFTGEDFATRWDSAIEAGVDKLEDEARRRAERGVERPVYQGGVMVGTVTEYSDTLMALLMKGNRPQKFNTERHELSGPGGGPVAMSMELEFIDPPKSNRK